MPEHADAAENVGKRIVRLVLGAAKNFLADDVPRMAAAMSYFLLLALSPIVVLANVLFSALGLATRQSAGGSTIAAASAAAAQGLQQATSWAGSFGPWVMAVLVIVGAASVFEQFIDAVNRIWKTPPKRTPVLHFLRQRGTALALLAVAAAAFVLALIVSGVVVILMALGLSYAQSLGIALPAWSVNTGVRALIVFVASALLFAVAFVVAPDRKIRWLDALPGALLTALVFTVGELLLSAYLGSTQRFAMFGASQFFMALTAWIYYSALVVLAGVEVTRLIVLDAETRRGDPPQPTIDAAAAAMLYATPANAQPPESD